MIECDIMRNNKGQALIEFVLILPVLILVIISMIDFGNIIVKKYDLENDIDNISTLYKEGKNIDGYLNSKNLSISYKNEDDFVTITLSKEINIISPVLVPIFGSKYEVSVEKSVINE